MSWFRKIGALVGSLLTIDVSEPKPTRGRNAGGGLLRSNVCTAPGIGIDIAGRWPSRWRESRRSGALPERTTFRSMMVRPFGACDEPGRRLIRRRRTGTSGSAGGQRPSPVPRAARRPGPGPAPSRRKAARQRKQRAAGPSGTASQSREHGKPRERARQCVEISKRVQPSLVACRAGSARSPLLTGDGLPTGAWMETDNCHQSLCSWSNGSRDKGSQAISLCDVRCAGEKCGNGSNRPSLRCDLLPYQNSSKHSD